MKKNKDDENLFTSANVGASLFRDHRVKIAIERVFRLTHNREMTADERRDFGLTNSSSGSKNGAARANGIGRKRKLQPPSR